jgi:hypothetical protein
VPDLCHLLHHCGTSVPGRNEDADRAGAAELVCKVTGCTRWIDREEM